MEDADVKFLANEIVRLIKVDFKRLHLSNNLVNTITVSEFDNRLVINIPAQIYNMYKYVKDKVIVYTNLGSYASQLEEEGSWIFNKHLGNHLRYISFALDGAVMALQDKVRARNDDIKVEYK